MAGAILVCRFDFGSPGLPSPPSLLCIMAGQGLTETLRETAGLGTRERAVNKQQVSKASLYRLAANGKARLHAHYTPL